MHCLQDQHLEHEHVIERRTPTLGAIGTRHCHLERRPEHLKIDERLHALKIVAFGRQLRQPFVDVEKSGRSLRHGRDPLAT